METTIVLAYIVTILAHTISYAMKFEWCSSDQYSLSYHGRTIAVGRIDGVEIQQSTSNRNVSIRVLQRQNSHGQQLQLF